MSKLTGIYDSLAAEYEQHHTTSLPVETKLAESVVSYLRLTMSSNEILTALEVGGGIGTVSFALQELGAATTMVEISPEMCTYARRRVKQVYCADYLEWISPIPGRYTLIVMRALLHLYDRPSANRMLHKAAEMGNYLYVSTSIHPQHEEIVEDKIGYLKPAARFRVKFTRESFRVLLAEAGWEQILSIDADDPRGRQHRSWTNLLLKRKF